MMMNMITNTIMRLNQRLNWIILKINIREPVKSVVTLPIRAFVV